MTQRALVVEDDPSVREMATMLLTRAGLDVTAVPDGKAALDRFSSDDFDVVVLDVMLPAVHGFDVCREMRRTSNIPIVMLTARDDVPEVVAGLELGADDYVTKPFDGSELVARVRAVLRRGQGSPQGQVLTSRDLEIDVAAFEARRDGEPVDLTATEFRLLSELAAHPGQVLTREVLLQRVWGYDYLGDSRLVDMAIKRVRDKLNDDPSNPTYISTVRGVGYRFERT